MTTAAGTAASGQTFSYQAAPVVPVGKCIVPKLTGKKLKAADCKLGRVKELNGMTSKTGKVKSQSAEPGKVLAPGSKVKVTLTP